ncbi:MAG: hypothetical protein J0H00_18935 [Burkholderiales bacterium]|nr:hypothetical protein [Burkholderiales bacterium]OJX05952.1 MAG: hypothetical protein BGO72_04650 [Burkholderiales bacterium 70-64]
MIAPKAMPPHPTRRRLAAALALVCVVLASGVAAAQPRGGRMDPSEREQLRRELSQQRVERSQRGEGAERPRNRLSPQEREQLRSQVREARPFEGRGHERGRN